MNLNLKIGQTLWATNGESVKICKIEVHKICLRYRGQEIWRDNSVLNTRLFLTKEEAVKRPASTKTVSNTSNGPLKDSCDNCMLMRREECFGEKKICEFYQHVPYVSKEEIDSWPTECLGAYENHYKKWR